MSAETDSTTKKRKQFDASAPLDGKEYMASPVASPQKRARHSEVDSGKVKHGFYKVSVSLYVSVAPVYLSDPLAGIKVQHLDPLLMTFSPEAGGVVLAHHNLQLCGQDRRPHDSNDEPIVAKVMYDSPFSFLWISVDLLIWRPKQGDTVEGYINMQSPSHIGLLIHDTFNASIKRDAIPRDWSFVPNQEDETEGLTETPNGEEAAAVPDADNTSNTAPRSLGYWVDSTGSKIDGKLAFSVKNFNVSGRTVSVQGSLIKPGALREDLTQRSVKEPEVKDTNHESKHVKFGDEVEEESKAATSSSESSDQFEDAREEAEEDKSSSSGSDSSSESGSGSDSSDSSDDSDRSDSSSEGSEDSSSDSE